MLDIWKSNLKKNSKVTWQTLEDECILLNLSTGDYYTLSEVGRFIWELFDGKKQLRDIYDEMIVRYDVDKDTAKSDILKIVQDLIREGLVEYTDTP